MRPDCRIVERKWCTTVRISRFDILAQRHHSKRSEFALVTPGHHLFSPFYGLVRHLNCQNVSEARIRYGAQDCDSDFIVGHPIAFRCACDFGSNVVSISAQTTLLLERIKAYSFPDGALAAHGVRAIKTIQRGEIRSSADARWVSFAAGEYVNATGTGFCWDAKLGTGVKVVHVIDAYENGHGRLVVKKGPFKLKELTGPELDRGELQRYLAYLSYCPAMMENNSSLQFAAVGPHTLRVSEKSDQTGASVDVEVDNTGRIVLTRTVRPMIVGSRIVMTPWSATTNDFKECEGLRIPYSMEASWAPLEGAFTYVRIASMSVTVVR